MVPTMGALHAGHLALLGEARRQCDRTVVTLFVNPTQFAPSEDLAAYPRNEDQDREKLAEAEANILFAPPADEIYPSGFDTTILVGGPSAGLESDFRPHFFAGVALVVAKLLLAGTPDKAFFGEKDYQQLLVVKKLVRDLNIATEIVGCPTIREADGLALSSRNRFLSPGERHRAPELHATLREAALRLRHGDDREAILAESRRTLAMAGFVVDYIEFRDAETLAQPGPGSVAPLRILAAARLGKTRLIDNLPV
jgi:pantoate--beta-alanine ligase